MSGIRRERKAESYMAATIRDVARLAGTSTATVSKVMNGSYAISQATVDRVRQAMEELQYHPNARARNFARQRTGQVLFLTTLGEGAGFSNPHMFEMMSGLECALGKKGYLLGVKHISPKEAPEFVREVFDSKAADGVVIHASVISKELDELIKYKEIPHLVLGLPSFNSHFCWMDIDNKLAGEVAANYLLQCGYQSLAFIGGTEEDKISAHRLAGVLSVLREYDVIVPGHHLQYGESDCESGFQMTAQLIQNPNLPDAIICANNYIAYGCVNALKESKIRIPDDMGLLTFDDYPFSRILEPKLTVVNIDVYDMGMQAGKLILNKMKKPNLQIQFYCTLPSVTERASTRVR
ncbi:MAG: LacI family transcriptional regulator [Ruminococcus flavefaciens]|nr:LacI family transcriptional regulator [Ruminococcus flavefaciens]